MVKGTNVNASRKENHMATAITYKVRDDDGSYYRAQAVHQMSYTPTLDDARQWDGETDKCVFVLDLLGLSLDSDGERYVDGKVNRVERAFDKLLSK
jgi:hypothetical protein